MQLIQVKELPQTLDVFVDGVLVGYADCIISDRHGEWYGIIDGDECHKLADNGEYVGVNDDNVVVNLQGVSNDEGI